MDYFQDPEDFQEFNYYLIYYITYTSLSLCPTLTRIGPRQRL